VTDLPALAAVELTPADPTLPLLVVGPSLGTSVEALWSLGAAELEGRYHVVGWDLPGHGRSAPATGPFSVEDLADGVWAIARRVLAERGEPDDRLEYAGDSLGGAVGLQLLLSRPSWRFARATLIATAARIGTSEGWHERAAQVRDGGTATLLDATAVRWFAPGFAAARPQVAGDLLAALRDADDASYAWACDALAEFDVRGLLGRIDVPIVAVAGGYDPVVPVEGLAELARSVADGRLVVLDDVAHLPPAEAPDVVADVLASLPERGEVTRGGSVKDERTQVESTPDGSTREAVRESGLAVRRAVLGESHVERAIAEATDVTRDFQDFITRYVWGEMWTRPGLDRRSRSLITLTALVALGHDDELALHLRGARRNGLSEQEITETLLQAAIYCGVPAANTAFRIAQRVLAEDD
jgi:3-oxoadipate enol-lactonase/4-carboxymuconolactone decarboxylase